MAGTARSGFWRQARRLFPRHCLWQQLQRSSRQPLAAHFSRQLKRAGPARALPLSLAWALILFGAFFTVFNAISHQILWTLPLWLMLFSLCYCACWLRRVVALLPRQARAGLTDEVSVMPRGQAYVYLLMAKAALHEGDALAWLTLLRRALAGLTLLCWSIALGIAAAQLEQIPLRELGALLMALALLALLFPLEHAQSVIIAWLTAIFVCARGQKELDRGSIAIVSFALLQILSYCLAVAVAIALQVVELSIVFALYLLLRECLIMALWQLLLRLLNSDDRPWAASAEENLSLSLEGGRDA